MNGSKNSLTPASQIDPDKILPIVALYFVLSLLGYFFMVRWTLPFPRDNTGAVIGRDFYNFWMYGRAAFTADPGRYYDWPQYLKALIEMLGADSGQNWSYPPSIMLIAAPFGLMSYLSAYIIWTVLATLAFILVARRHFGDMKLLAVAALSPAALFCLISGQSSLLSAAIILSIFSLLDRRPLVAGFLIGCLTLKPQLGLLFPFMLLVTRRWRVFASAAITTLAIAIATAIIFGPQVWMQFIFKGLPIQNLWLTDPTLQCAAIMPTIFMNARQLGLTYAQSLGVQSLFSVAAVLAVCWGFWKHADADKALLFALFTACSVCVTPYLLSYDLMPLTCAIVPFLMRRDLDKIGQRLVFFVYWLMVIQYVLGLYHIPGPALLVPVFIVYLVRQLSETARAPQTAAA